MRKTTDNHAAFKAFYEGWITHNPHADEYLPFDFNEFFTAGSDSHREYIWHKPEEVPEHGKTVVAIDVDSGTCELSYGGGYIEHGYWAYAEDLLNDAMLLEVWDKEAELRAWVEQEQRQLEKRRVEELLMRKELAS